MADTPLTFLDLETTGTRATRDRITEIAALRVLDGNVVDRFVTLVDPGVLIPPSITALTGISNEMVQGQPAFETIADEFYRWIDGSILVAHNARFDISFLRNEYRRLGVRFGARVICTLRLSRQLEPDHYHHSLGELLRRHDLLSASRHRALSDTKALLSLWQHWSRYHAAEKIESLAVGQFRNRSLPAHLDPHLLDELPTRPGVYLFLGQDRMPLYIGKSVNLRSRVLSHFNSDYRNDREMKIMRQLHHLEWHETAGDLGAQLLEARLIKQLSPIYNRKLRRQSTLKTWCWRQSAGRLELAGPEALGSTEEDMTFGMFRSRGEATRALRQIAEEHRLCPRILGLESGRGRCFSHQLGRCRGACCGEESITSHTERLLAALEKLRIHHWPWPGRVAFRECDDQGIATYHLVDQWRYLGSVTHLMDAPERKKPTAFDADTYRILHRFMTECNNSNDIIVLD
ncbi:DNA polymerase III subunit epsilon [Kushneria phosphatilytica]|uniref:DNA-directed DNA polymerase n=1 Tax=Kushneria phosphatilytica TaxID=657387 RepID=A0A1S1NYA0_9GAMM|nr:DNA polymerase III subunit epsilon [Kushneria phosphatilytica]QEL12789.1 DNA polymerase III subunit epsilon [Kushneria phosphatilytica]